MSVTIKAIRKTEFSVRRESGENLFHCTATERGIVIEATYAVVQGAEEMEAVYGALREAWTAHLALKLKEEP